MLSLDERRSVSVGFLVDLREKTVTNYRHFVATPVGDERVKVARYANGRPVRVFPWIIIGKDYVIAEDGRRLSYQQFFAEEQNRLEEQRASSAGQVDIAQSCTPPNDPGCYDRTQAFAYNVCFYSVGFNCTAVSLVLTINFGGDAGFGVLCASLVDAGCEAVANDAAFFQCCTS